MHFIVTIEHCKLLPIKTISLTTKSDYIIPPFVAVLGQIAIHHWLYTWESFNKTVASYLCCVIKALFKSPLISLFCVSKWYQFKRKCVILRKCLFPFYHIQLKNTINTILFTLLRMCILFKRRYRKLYCYTE